MTPWWLCSDAAAIGARGGAAGALRLRRITLLCATAALGLSGCAGGVPEAGNGVGPQAFYRTGFAVQDVSGALEAILASVVRIQVAGTYDVYVFDEPDAPTDEEVYRPGAPVLPRASQVDTATTIHFATAVVLASRGPRGTLVTTDHGAHLPDTTLEYFDSSGSGRGRTIERLAILRHKTSTVVGATFVEPFHVLARNEREDLTLIGVEMPEHSEFGPTPLPVRDGSPGRLSWGSLVYILGYPIGYRMITRAVVSRPDLGEGNAFLTDALVNEGASGAPIVAIRGDSGALEWVGVARAAATRPERRLIAKPGAQPSADFSTPYDGPVYLRDLESIRYGIAFSIPIDEIRAFVSDQAPRLIAAGYPAPDL